MRELSDQWSFAAVFGGTASAAGDNNSLPPSAFACAPLRGGLRAEGSLRISLPLPAHMRPQAGAIRVSGWLVYALPSPADDDAGQHTSDATPACVCFPVLHAMLDVLHTAQPAADGALASTWPPAVPAAASHALTTMHARIALPVASGGAADVMEQACGGAVGARAVVPAAAAMAVPPASLRVAVSRDGVAHFTATSAEPHVPPLVRLWPAFIQSCSPLVLMRHVRAHRRCARRCCVARWSAGTRMRRRRRHG